MVETAQRINPVGLCSNREGIIMKLIPTTLAGMIAVSGLVLAGAETTNLTSQFLTCLAGIGMFAGGMLWINKIFKEERP